MSKEIVVDYHKFYKQIKKINFKELQQQLEKEAKIFLENNFNLSLNIPIKIDGRLSKANGSFHYSHNGYTGKKVAKLIKISKNYLIDCYMADSFEYVILTLKHELIHYALFTLGKDFTDGDETFEKTLAELKVPSSCTTPRNKTFSTVPKKWFVRVTSYVDDNYNEYNYTNKDSSLRILNKDSKVINLYAKNVKLIEKSYV